MSGSEKRRRRHSRTARYDDQELAELEARAEKAGLTVAGYIRSCTLDKPPPRQSKRPTVNHVELAKVQAGIGRIGSNVNQMAKLANCGRWPGYLLINDAVLAILEMRNDVQRALGVIPPEDVEHGP